MIFGGETFRGWGKYVNIMLQRFFKIVLFLERYEMFDV